MPPEADLGLFRTQQLRQITSTGPYMHNGSSATLDDVLQLYNAGGGDGGVGALDKAFNGHVPVSPADQAHLLELMKTLTGDPPEATLLQDTSAP
jgi:cytochrome c peroxidase